ncbi:MAG: MoaD/ThiS family protein [Alsobacter sp.]
MSDEAARPDREDGPVQVTLPPLVATLFPGVPRVLEARGRTVSDVIDALDADWPGLRDCFCDSRPAIRRHINVFVSGRRVGLDHPLEPGSAIAILTAISGG